MPQDTQNLAFDQWVDYVFDHPVTEPQWYFEVDQDGNSKDWWRGGSELIIDYCTRLFERPDDLSQRFSREQLAQGFWYIASAGASDYMLSLHDESVRWSERKRCIDSIATLFERFFARECSGELGHLQKSNQNYDHLTTTCYMWWDVFSSHYDSTVPHQEDFEEAILAAMEAILHLPSEACIESALHGLGHEQAIAPQEVGAIIDRFLRGQPRLSPELRTYALVAREGNVQ